MKIKLFTISAFLSLVIIANAQPGNQYVNHAPLRGDGMQLTENKGQVVDMNGQLRPDILYTGDGGGAKVYLRKGGFSYVFTKTDGLKNFEPSIDKKEFLRTTYKNPSSTIQQSGNTTIQFHRIDVDFENSNVNVSSLNEGRVEGYTNYYYGHCHDGILNVNSYNEVTLENIYDNINVKYYGNKERGLKYDIVVKPGGNPNDIKLKYSGAESITLENSTLKLESSLGTITEYMPRVYQNINGKIVDIKTEYILDGTTVAFKIHKYNLQLPLVIDPAANWVTYYGGTSSEQANSITTDPIGNIIFTGITTSINFPISAGSFQSVAPTNLDAFLVKMDADGNRIFATYLGGTKAETGYGIATDNSGNILVTGKTWSKDLPVGSTGGNVVHQSLWGGGATANNDAFLFKFDPTGARIWGTYYGGTGEDFGYDVCVDKNTNEIYLYGQAYSTNAISTSGSFQQAKASGLSDVFVAKFNANGTRSWASYIGGSGMEDCGGIDCDPLGNVYIGGYTSSANFPTSIGAHQSIKPPVWVTSFVFKFSSTGNRLWATYYGGNVGEYGEAIACDLLGNVILAGSTSSTIGMSTAGVCQTNQRCSNGNAFIVKFNSAGVRQWGTYFGGSKGVPGVAGGEEVSGLACDANNNIVVAGDTYSIDLPVSSCAVQKILIGSEDQFIATFSPSGVCICSDYLGQGGPTSMDNETWPGAGGCIAVSGVSVYLAASTYCNYPVTSGAYQAACGGSSDCAIAKICLTKCGVTTIPINFTNNTNVCEGNTVGYTLNVSSCDSAETTYQWTLNGATPSTSTEQNPTVTYLTPGTYFTKVVVSTPCGTDSLTKNSAITVDPLPSVNIGNLSTCIGQSTTISATANGGTPIYSYAWNNGSTGSTIIIFPTVTSVYSVSVTDANGCIGAASNNIMVNPLPEINFSQNDSEGCAPVCISFTPQSNPPAVLAKWTFGDSTNSNTLNPSHCYVIPGSYPVALTITDINGCTASVNKPNAVQVYSQPLAAFIINPSGVVPQNSVINFTDTSLGIINSWQWSFGNVNKSSSSQQSPNFNYQDTGTYRIQLIITNVYGCSDTVYKIITIDEEIDGEPTLYIANTFTPNGDGKNDMFLPFNTGISSSKYLFSIFDRWGSLIFETNDPSQGWNGRANGGKNIAQEDTYVWKLEYTNLMGAKKSLLGSVNIIR